MPTQNLGQLYEERIRQLLKRRELLPADLQGNDAGFMHRGKAYYLEVKSKTAPDFGQKGLVWSPERGWEWRERDVITDLYDKFDVIDLIDKNFKPRRYSVPKDEITAQDKKFDQQHFERSGIELTGQSYLYEYYARKQCFYIQIEGRGFYYLKQDAADLHVPQFIPELTLRLRAKTHHSTPIYAYSFFAVIQAKRVEKSAFDLQERVGIFPPIVRG